jgi:hypothetical protein
MVRCELCGKSVLDKMGVFTEWTRTVPPYRGMGYAKVRATKFSNYEPSRDPRKAHVYCPECRKRVNQILNAIWFY